MKVTVIGANGFLGSAFVRFLRTQNVELVEVTPLNYIYHYEKPSDVVIHASGNSKKPLANENPAQGFASMVERCFTTLLHFPAKFHIHLSSVDVYRFLDSRETTKEHLCGDWNGISHYGAFKLLEENLVKHFSKHCLILRLAGMVGVGLTKNPVFDILNRSPLYVHPESRYHFMNTDDVAKIAWKLFSDGVEGVMNLTGDGTISPLEIATLAGVSLTNQLNEYEDRNLDINLEKIKQFVTVPSTFNSIQNFILDWKNK